jgi:hypothetical protein
VAYALALFLLANTHFLGTLLAISFFVIDLPEVSNKGRVLRNLAISAIALAGIVIAFLQVVPPRNSAMVNNWLNGITSENVYNSLFLPAKAFVPVFEFDRYHFWNHFAVMRLYYWPLVILTVIFTVIAIYLLIPDWVSLIFFLLSAFSICGFLAISRLSGARYYGVVFLAFIAALWLNRTRTVGIQSSGCFKEYVIYLVLAIQVAGGIPAWWLDVRHPFSESKNLAAFIVRNGLANRPLVMENCLRASVLPYLEQKAYFVSSSSIGSFCKWNEMGFPFAKLSQDTLLFRAKAFSANSNGALLVTNSPLVEPDKDTKLLGAFVGSIVETENFYLYQIYR